MSLSTDAIGVSAGVMKRTSPQSDVDSHGWRWESEGKKRRRVEYVPWDVGPEDMVVGLDLGRRTHLSTTAGGLDMSLDKGGLAERGVRWSLSLRSWRHLAKSGRDQRRRQLWVKNDVEVSTALLDHPQTILPSFIQICQRR